MIDELKKVVIEENSSLSIEDKYIPYIEEILKRNNDVPIYLDGNILSFSEYTVGILKVDDLIIEIKSRNEAVTMNAIFEMYSYVNNGQSDFEDDITGFSFGNSFELTSLSRFFYKVCSSLLQIGLTGRFNSQKESSHIIRGNIVFEEYIKKEIPMKGLNIVTDEYSINCSENQLIKAAITKLIETELNEENMGSLHSLLREFSYVEDKRYTLSELSQLETSVKNFYSSNSYYPVVIEMSLQILKDLKTSYNNGKLEWYMFLINSNDLFEKYVRKILEDGLNESIIKWKEPKQFASITYNTQQGGKSYSPDIIVDYQESSNISRAVMDVKNKRFYPDKQNTSELVSPADLYQILFYCRKLKTQVGAIIYPTKGNFDPIKIEIDDENDPIIHLISVNMDDNFGNRYNKLILDIKNNVLSLT